MDSTGEQNELSFFFSIFFCFRPNEKPPAKARKLFQNAKDNRFDFVFESKQTKVLLYSVALATGNEIGSFSISLVILHLN